MRIAKVGKAGHFRSFTSCSLLIRRLLVTQPRQHFLINMWSTCPKECTWPGYTLYFETCYESWNSFPVVRKLKISAKFDNATVRISSWRSHRLRARDSRGLRESVYLLIFSCTHASHLLSPRYLTENTSFNYRWCCLIRGIITATSSVLSYSSPLSLPPSFSILKSCLQEINPIRCHPSTCPYQV